MDEKASVDVDIIFVGLLAEKQFQCD